VNEFRVMCWRLVLHVAWLVDRRANQATVLSGRLTTWAYDHVVDVEARR